MTMSDSCAGNARIPSDGVQDGPELDPGVTLVSPKSAGHFY